MIISGAIRGTSSETVLGELGWCSISKRREIHKLVLFYKIFHREALRYLSEAIPGLVHERTNYNLRNADIISILASRLQLFYKIFLSIHYSWLEYASSRNKNIFPCQMHFIDMVRDKVMLRMLGCGWAAVSSMHICLEIMLSTAQHALAATYTKMRIITCLYVLGTWCNGTKWLPLFVKLPLVL